MSKLSRKLLRRLRQSFMSLFASFGLLVTLGLTFIDVLSNDDTTISPNSSLNNEDVQYEIRKNEAIFRDQIYTEIKEVYATKDFSIIDSLTYSSKEISEIKKYVIINRLKDGKTSYKFDITAEKITSPFIELEKITTTFNIDFEKINDIIKSTKSETTEESIKYGNYLNTNYKFVKKIRYDYLIIALFVLIALIIITYYRKRIGTKSKEKFETVIEDLQSDKENIKQAQEILNDENISKSEIDFLKKLVNKIAENLNSYKFESILESVLYSDVSKAEKKSLELYNRSTLMLILGLLIAVVGILIFYFTLPEFKKNQIASNYLALTIRPTLLLLFIQSISFYLLRQYRSLISDYKYFHEEYLKKSKTFVIYQLMQNKNISDTEMKLIDSLLESDSKKSEWEEKEEISTENVLDIIKILISKIK